MLKKLKSKKFLDSVVRGGGLITHVEVAVVAARGLVRPPGAIYAVFTDIGPYRIQGEHPVKGNLGT